MSAFPLAHFAGAPDAVFAQWADGPNDAGIDRVIVVGKPSEVPKPDPLAAIGAEYVAVDSNGTGTDLIAAKAAAAETATSTDS